jgi:hypothetical protein
VRSSTAVDASKKLRDRGETVAGVDRWDMSSRWLSKRDILPIRSSAHVFMYERWVVYYAGRYKSCRVS